MIRRPAARTAPLLVCLLLATSCGDGEELTSLRNERVADLTEVDDRLTETLRHEVDAGESLGKPVYAQITATYVVEGDPAEVLDDVVQAAKPTAGRSTTRPKRQPER